jgi:ATP-dependent Lon protease
MTEQNSTIDFSTEDIPQILPILPLFDAALFPKMVLPLVVMEGESIQLIDEAMAKKRIVGLLFSKKKTDEPIQPDKDLAKVGTSALILKMAKSEENRTHLLVQGLSRFKVISFEKGKPYSVARVENLKDKEKKDNEIEALMSNLTGLFNKIVKLSPGLPPEIGEMSRSVQEPGILADMIASTMNSSAEEKQKVLEIVAVRKRLKEVTRLANHQLEILELGNKIQSQVKGGIDKTQREYYLRQQLKAIKEELGEKDEATVETEDYKAKIEEKNLPEEAKKEAERELSRLS